MIYKIIILMVLQMFVSVLIIMVLHLGYKSVGCLKSKLVLVREARQKGYRVFEHPFCWFGSAMYGQFKKNQATHNDAHYHYKNELSSYDIIVSNLIFRTMVEIQSPEIAKEFFIKANEGYYHKAEIGIGNLRRLIGVENLLLSDGEYWRNRRKAISSVFNFEFINKQIPQIQGISKGVLEDLQKTGGESHQINCNIAEPLMNVFSTVILRCFFKGEQFNKIGQQKTIDFLNRILLEISDVGRSKMGIFLGVKFSQMGLTQKNRKINQEVQKFRSAAKQLILKRIKQIKELSQQNKLRSETESVDIIEALIKNKEIIFSEPQEKSLQNREKEQIINVDNLINEFGTFFIAGSETTLAFTRMMIYRLACYPQIMAKVREEFEREANTYQITLSQLKNLKYFEKVQKEVLRMDSSVGAVSTRIAQKDHYLGKLKIYKGTAVNIRIRGTHYKQSQFQNPHRFWPDRWDEKNAKNSPFGYIPFSSGARNCIGKHLALLENKIFMIELLRRFKDIKISKHVDEIKMKVAVLYGPEEVMTTLIKR